MKQGAAYAQTGGVPDQFVIESWLKVPEKGIPETDPSSLMGSVKDFHEKYMQ